MTETVKAKIIPSFRYRDAEKAIDFLCEAFGFERHLVVRGEAEGDIAHAQLVSPAGMIMLGSARDDDYARLQRPPPTSEGPSTQSPYIVVPDADAHHERAKAAGARIVLDLVDQAHGGRGYSCLDPEGHVWHFGTYDPWAEA